MYIEFYLYGLLLGLSVCSACTLPLFLLSGGGKKTLGYIFGARFLLLLGALPLIAFAPYLRIAGSILMLGVGIYGFMMALEGTNSACTKGVLAAAFVCFTEGLPAVLLADGYISGMLNALLFTAGTLTPLALVSTLKLKIDNRLRTVVAGFVILIGVLYLYESLFVAGSLITPHR
ncbi:MAG: hypothetical protein N3F63_03590 [Thermoplasmata archaeon]|nr:hypothetical protein [Thermoplasmata archaeon]